MATIQLKVEQLAVATALGEKTRTAYSFEITDAAVADLDNLLKNKKVSKLSIVDTATNIANNVDTIVKNIQKLNNIEISGADKELNITAAQLRSSQAVLGKITKGYDLALSGATLRDVTQYGNNAKIKSITVLDTSANIAKNISALNQLGEKLTSISQSGKPTTLRLNATDVTANASVFAKISDAYSITATGNIEGINTLLENTKDKSKIVSVNYVDTAANVQKSLNKLGSSGVQSSINLTDSSPTMVMTGEQINSNKTVLGSIKTPFKIEDTNVSISQLKDIATIKNVSTISIVDTAKNIGDGINAVAWIVSKVKDITQTDKNGILSITAAQAKLNAAVLAKIKSGYKLALSMVPAANTTSFTNDRNVISIELHDSVSNMVANLQSINVARSKIKTINIFDRSTTIASNLYELSKIKNADVKIKQSDPQNVIALKADDLIANKSLVSKAIQAGSVAIRDTADNIAKHIDNISTMTDQIRSITRADG